MRKLLIAIGVILVLLVATSIQSSAQDNNVIYGCYDEKSGKLRIVNDLGECKKKEVPISWNQEGPEGPQGPPGEGAVKVYDANDQFLGIYVDGGMRYATHIFIPSLNAFARLQLYDHYEDCEELGNIYDRYWIYYDDTGKPYVSEHSWISPLPGCGSEEYRYYVGRGKKLCIGITSQRNGCNFNEFDPPKEEVLFEAVEIPAEDIPFDLPVKLPLRYE